MAKITTVGIDLAKSVFSVHAIDESGAVLIRKTVSRVKRSGHATDGHQRRRAYDRTRHRGKRRSCARVRQRSAIRRLARARSSTVEYRRQDAARAHHQARGRLSANPAHPWGASNVAEGRSSNRQAESLGARGESALRLSQSRRGGRRQECTHHLGASRERFDLSLRVDHSANLQHHDPGGLPIANGNRSDRRSENLINSRVAGTCILIQGGI